MLSKSEILKRLDVQIKGRIAPWVNRDSGLSLCYMERYMDFLLDKHVQSFSFSSPPPSDWRTSGDWTKLPSDLNFLNLKMSPKMVTRLCRQYADNVRYQIWRTTLWDGNFSKNSKEEFKKYRQG